MKSMVAQINTERNPFTYKTVSGQSITVEREKRPWNKSQYVFGFFNPDTQGRDGHAGHYLKNGQWVAMPKDTMFNGKLALVFGKGDIEVFNATFLASVDERHADEHRTAEELKELSEKLSIQRFNTVPIVRAAPAPVSTNDKQACACLPSMRQLFPVAFRVADEMNRPEPPAPVVRAAPAPVSTYVETHETIETPEPVQARPMTRKQSYALYCIMGKDWRKSKVKLSIVQASAMIAAANSLIRRAA